MTRLRVACGPTLVITGAVISIAGVLDPVRPIALLAGLVLAILGVLAITAELEHRDTLAHGVDAHRQAMQALRPPNTWTPRKDHS